MAAGTDLFERIQSALHVRLDDVRAAAGGQQRTYFAEQSGTPVVVKWGLDPDLPAKIPYVARQVPELLRRGTPVPQILAHGPLSSGGYAWVQQRLPGNPATTLTTALLDELIDLLQRHAHAPDGNHRSNISAWARAVVHDDDAGWWANTITLSPDAEQLTHTLREWISAVPQASKRHDYVHIDLNLGNVLIDGTISGIVDLENLGVGDRTIDVARLAFEWFWQHRNGTPGLAPGGLSRLASYGRSINGEAGWRTAITYEVISRLGWRSEHTTPVDPSTLVAASAELVDAVRSAEVS